MVNTSLIKDVNNKLIPVNKDDCDLKELKQASEASSDIITIDIDKIKNRGKLGKWLAGEQLYSVLTMGVINQEIIEKCLVKCTNIISQSEDEDSIIKAMMAANQLISTSATWAGIQIKISEISGMKDGDEKRNKNAPLFKAQQMQVNLFKDEKGKKEE